MPPEDGSAEAHQSPPGVGRLLSLSDGVVAIALTLLVLQLRVPGIRPGAGPGSAHALAHQLRADTAQFTTYVISFLVIAQFWLVHHRVFRQITGHREGLAWWNFAFLFAITLMPFTSALLSAYSGNPLAVDIFAVNLLLASIATHATLVYGHRKGLLVPGTGMRDLRAGRVRSVLATVVLAGSTGVAWVSTDAAKYCWLLIALGPWAAARWDARTAGPSG
jgi:TMEM175 potassium channel family protein